MSKQQGKQIKVRMKVSIAASTFSYQEGQVVLLDEEFAMKLINVGDRAERVDKETPVTDPTTLASNDFMMHDPTVASRLHGTII